MAPLLLPVTDTDALAAAEPPAPLQLSVNVLLAALSAPVLAEPDVGRLPLQAPLALQLVASVDDQVRFELPPLVTELGLALIVTVGAGVVDVGVTVTVTDRSSEPPVPVQVSVKTLLGLLSAPVLAVPAVARMPVQAPLALQLVASVEVQTRLALAPVGTLLGFAESEIVGDGTAAIPALGGGESEPPPPQPLSKAANIIGSNEPCNGLILRIVRVRSLTSAADANRLQRYPCGSASWRRVDLCRIGPDTVRARVISSRPKWRP
ncbi:MAG: hypothetical protein R3F58_15340 [Steroidobacteraceae bacterium]